MSLQYAINSDKGKTDGGVVVAAIQVVFGCFRSSFKFEKAQ